MSKAKTILMLSAILMFVTVPAMAVPVDVYSDDGPQDPLWIEGPVHELGDWFPPDELIESSWEFTDITACIDGPVYDDPAIPNILVSMFNFTYTYWEDVHYVADPDTTISNYDGWIGNMGMGDAQYAFRIDYVGVNTPLFFESMNPDNIFEPGERWDFIIQDFQHPQFTLATNWTQGTPTPFDSIGIAGASAGWPPSTGSIIAVPEPMTMSLLVLGGIGALLRRRSK